MLGRYFIQYLCEKGYGDMLRSLGRNLFEYLNNLSHIHKHISYAMPDVRTPDLWLVQYELLPTVY